MKKIAFTKEYSIKLILPENGRVKYITLLGPFRTEEEALEELDKIKDNVRLKNGYFGITEIEYYEEIGESKVHPFEDDDIEK